ncbi:hypothetical protein C5167_014026 [Papaver somniferum]|uniref:Secoisolariciresinol dehydrogenase n=1 Tax=Papaver somniferum TaxID=3469 RepID=A0A4Y7J616_PAPSO|nr:(-)-isopiperitenol/(-)-carveol dehydrogenase, mitochondrial-like [Papaver somniferum]RZC55169.1 hypothetical protein C5167_014026 [Papaver somniferum]
MAEVISVQNENKLEGKVIIITAGASGIGEATARLFGHHNPRMIVISDIQDKLGQDVVTSVGPQMCSYIHCDVTGELQVKSTVDSTVKRYGGLDIMFSNAGIVNFNQQTILDLDLSAYDRLMAINARGMLACVKHAARAMVDGGSKGSIVCTASIAASLPLGGYVDYGMSKHAVLGLMRSASVQLGKYGVSVNCVSPSALGTPMTCQAYGTDVEGVEKRFLSSCALGGDGLALKAIANAVLFLASDDSAFITGHDLVVDGGYIPSSLTH